MENKPIRIQRKRTKGFNLQTHSRLRNQLPCVTVSRPSKFGNPFTVEQYYDAGYSPRPASVVFAEGGWMSYFPIGTTGTKWVIRLDRDAYFTVIGNIHENPSLLTPTTPTEAR